jgi:hypothetical protein
MTNYTFTINRKYETLVEIESDTYESALEKLSKTDIYSIELEQCCVVEENIVCEEKYKKFARQCDKCKQGMNEGYVINGGDEYYCDDKCLHQEYTPEEWYEMSNGDDDDSYWTEWEDDDDYQYELINGILTEIED